MPDIVIGQDVFTVPPAFRYTHTSLDEYLTDFQASSLVKTVAQMRNDPMIAEVLNGFKYSLLQADWKVERAGDGANEREQAEFVEAAFFHRGGEPSWRVESSLRQRINEACESYLLGFAAWGRKWEETDDGRWIPKRMPYIHPSTIMCFRLSDVDESLIEIGRLNVPQPSLSLRDPRERRNASIYTFDYTGVNYRGRPLIRPMWRAFSMGTFAHKVALIALQKYGSPLPWAKTPPDKEDDDEFREHVEDILRMMRGEDPAKGFARTTSDVELGFAQPEHEPMDATKIIERHAVETLHAGGQAHKARGDTSVGGRSSAETQSRDFYVMAQGVAEAFAENMVNGTGTQKGEIWDTLVVNYGTRFKEPPHVSVTNVDPLESVRDVPAIGELISKGAIKYHPAYELQICRRYDLDPRPGLEEEAEMDGDEYAQLMQERMPQIPTAAPGQPSDGKTPPPSSSPGAQRPGGPPANEEEPDETRASVADESRRIKRMPDGARADDDEEEGPGAKPSRWFRDPTRFEKTFVNLGLIDSKTSWYVDRFAGVVRKPLAAAEDDVISRIRSGAITTRNYHTLRKGMEGPSVKYEARVRDKVYRLRQQVSRFGASQVRAELAQQHARHRNEQAFALPRGRQVVKITSDELLKGAVVDASKLIERLTSSIIDQMDMLSRQDLSQGELADAMEAYLSTLSQRPIRDLARQSITVSFNLGRNMEIQRHVDEIAGVVRTAILDQATCGPCRGLDGRKYAVNSDGYFEFMPPNKCEGMARCRCFYLVVADLGDEEEAA